MKKPQGRWSSTDLEPEPIHGIAQFLAGCTCSLCYEAQADRMFYWRLGPRLEKLRAELQMEDWEIELQRDALIYNREVKRCNFVST